MAKFRLTQGWRDRLIQHARKVNTPDPFTTKYLAARQAVFEAILARYPAKDMLLLKKYEAVQPALTNNPYGRTSYIRLVDTSINHRETDFSLVADDETPAPLRPSANFGVAIPVTTAIYDLVVAYKAELEDAEAKINARMEDYAALIRGAKYFEDVIEVWAEAADIKPTTTCTALSTVTPELAHRIADDVTSRRANLETKA